MGHSIEWVRRRIKQIHLVHRQSVQRLYDREQGANSSLVHRQTALACCYTYDIGWGTYGEIFTRTSASREEWHICNLRELGTIFFSVRIIQNPAAKTFLCYFVYLFMKSKAYGDTAFLGTVVWLHRTCRLMGPLYSYVNKPLNWVYTHRIMMNQTSLKAEFVHRVSDQSDLSYRHWNWS